MNFDLALNIPAATVFVQGLLSFFSPCVLPLIPLYLGYLSGDLNGERVRRKLILNTFFFALGISCAFFILGLGISSVAIFFSDYRNLFVIIGGIIIVFLGLHQLGIIQIPQLEREHRFQLKSNKVLSGPLAAFIMGFTFSFAWTPCVGPILAGVLLMAASEADSTRGFFLIGVYTLGFVIPFLVVSFFADSLLDVLRKHKNFAGYTVKIGGALLVVIGIMMISGFMGTNIRSVVGAGETPESTPLPTAAESAEPKTTSESAAPDFALIDQFGNEHTLSDYRGKIVFLNFWATWCPPCRMEMPDIQQLYEDYGKNLNEIVVLGVAAPNIGREGTAEEIAKFLEENGYTYPTVMDNDGEIMSQYAISAFPTTFMIDKNGNIFGYISGALAREDMEKIIAQTIENSD